MYNVHPMIVWPAFKLQQELQAVTLGVDEWYVIQTRLETGRRLAKYVATHNGEMPPLPWWQWLLWCGCDCRYRKYDIPMVDLDKKVAVLAEEALRVATQGPTYTDPTADDAPSPELVDGALPGPDALASGGVHRDGGNAATSGSDGARAVPVPVGAGTGIAAVTPTGKQARVGPGPTTGSTASKASDGHTTAAAATAARPPAVSNSSGAGPGGRPGPEAAGPKRHRKAPRQSFAAMAAGIGTGIGAAAPVVPDGDDGGGAMAAGHASRAAPHRVHV